MDPIVLRPDEGESLDIAGNKLIFKANPDQTGGAYVVSDYGKIGVSTRAEAAVFAMEHGLTETATAARTKRRIRAGT